MAMGRDGQLSGVHEQISAITVRCSTRKCRLMRSTHCFAGGGGGDCLLAHDSLRLPSRSQRQRRRAHHERTAITREVYTSARGYLVFSLQLCNRAFSRPRGGRAALTRQASNRGRSSGTKWPRMLKPIPLRHLSCALQLQGERIASVDLNSD